MESAAEPLTDYIHSLGGTLARGSLAVKYSNKIIRPRPIVHVSKRVFHLIAQRAQHSQHSVWMSFTALATDEYR